MKDFIIIGNKAVTGGKISLNDLCGSAGRMDVMCRCITASLFVSFGMRRDVNVHIVLKGPPSNPKIVRFSGEYLRYLNPDERSAGSLIQKALLLPENDIEKESTPGVYVRTGTLETLIREFSKENRNIILMDENGQNIREAINKNPNIFENPVYILGDNQGILEEDFEILKNYEKEYDIKKISIGEKSLLTSQCITIIHYETDFETTEK